MAASAAMRAHSAEQLVSTGFTALVCASWSYVGAAFLHASLTLALLCALAGAAVGGTGMWLRYRSVRAQEEAAEHASLFDRLASMVAMAAVGAVFGYLFPLNLSPSLDWRLRLAIASTLAFPLALLAWRHPALFYRNRRL